MDSVCKNHSRQYMELFSASLVSMFKHVFASVQDVQVRMSMHKLRNTWGEIFPASLLHQLDVQVKELDPKWPIAEVKSVESGAGRGGAIHINPAFLGRKRVWKALKCDFQHICKCTPLLQGLSEEESEAEKMAKEVEEAKKELLRLQKEMLVLEIEKQKKDLLSRKVRY